MMTKPDLNARKRKKRELERNVEENIPEELLSSYNDVWGRSREKVELIKISELESFHDAQGRSQPFEQAEEKIRQIILSARDIGIITPLIVRRGDEKYQIISGHHRYEAGKRLGLLALPCVVRDISDGEAVRLIAESNIQRSKMLPTEYANIYARYMEMRSDIGLTIDEISEKFGISRKTLFRYIRINDLTDELKEMINIGKMNADTAEIIGDFSQEHQKLAAEFITRTNKTINRFVAKEMQKIVEKKKEKTTIVDFIRIINIDKDTLNKDYRRFAKKYSVDYSNRQWNELIDMLLEKHFSGEQ